METILYLSIFWIIYGIIGTLGFQIIPNKFKGYSWTKNYVRHQGLSWLVLGLPWLAFYLLSTYSLLGLDLGTGVNMLILVILSIPSIAYSIYLDKKYETLKKTTARAMSA